MMFPSLDSTTGKTSVENESRSFLKPRLSRRNFLGRLSATFLPLFSKAAPPAPIRLIANSNTEEELLPDYRLTPHYRMKSPIDDVIRLVQPGLDAFPTEK